MLPRSVLPIFLGRWAPLVLIVGLAACASGGASSVATPSSAPVVLVGGQGMPTGDGAGAFTHSTIMSDRPTTHAIMVAGKPADVWKLAEGVYAALDIPVTLKDVPNGQLGNRSFWKRRVLGPRRMSELVNCGSGATGQNADAYRIQMSLTTTLTAKSDQTLVETLLIAYGQDVGGDSTAPVQCASTGALENMINQSIQANLAQHPSP